MVHIVLFDKLTGYATKLRTLTSVKLMVTLMYSSTHWEIHHNSRLNSGIWIHAGDVEYCTWQDWTCVFHHCHTSGEMKWNVMDWVYIPLSLHLYYIMLLIMILHSTHTLKDEVNFYLQWLYHCCVCEIQIYIAQTLLNNVLGLQTRLAPSIVNYLFKATKLSASATV